MKSDTVSFSFVYREIIFWGFIKIGHTKLETTYTKNETSQNIQSYTAKKEFSYWGGFEKHL